MSEEMNQTNQEGQKTVIAFVAGLLVGGLLVWVFGSPSEQAPTDLDNDNSAPVTEGVDPGSVASDSNLGSRGDMDSDTEVKPFVEASVGAGAITVSDQPAGDVVVLGSVTFPEEEGWIGVREYQSGQLTGLLGVARWSVDQGLIPSEVKLLRSTESGSQYALVFYSENGDREFNLANDVQIEGVVATFTAR